VYSCTVVSIIGGLITNLILWDLLEGIDDEDFDFLGFEPVDFATKGEGACEVNTVGMDSGSEEEGVLDGNTIVIGLGLYSRNDIKQRLVFGGGDGGVDTAWWEGERGDSVWWDKEGGGESGGGIGGGSVSEVSGGKVSLSVSSIWERKKKLRKCCVLLVRRRERKEEEEFM